MITAEEMGRAVEYARRLTASGVEDDGNMLSRAPLTLLARAEKAEAIAERCGLLASQDREARERAEKIAAAWGQFWLTREEHESLAAAWESARTDGAAASIAPRRDAAKVAREEAEARLRALGVDP